MIDTTYLQSLKDKIKQPITDYFSQLKSSIDEQIKPQEPIPQNGDESEIINKIKDYLLSAPIGKIYQSIQQRSFEPIKQELTKKIDITNPEELAKIRERTMMMTIGMTEPLAKVKTFQGLKGLSTKLLERFKGMPEEITPQQFNEVINKATKEGIRKADLDMIKEMAERQIRKIKQGIKVYRATEIPFDKTKIDKYGISIGESLEDAEYFLTGKRKMEILNIDKNARILKDIPNELLEKPKGWEEGDYLFINEDKLVEFAKKHPEYDGYKFIPEQNNGISEIRIFNPDIIMTKQGFKLSLPQLAKDVETQLVPLTPIPVKSPRYSSVGQDFIGDGKYGEIVYQSPIKTGGAEQHFSRFERPNATYNQSFPNYFSHIRYEDMADGKTRKILETQSDLFQKENFAREIKEILPSARSEVGRNIIKRGEASEMLKRDAKRYNELQKFQPYSSNDPLSHLRTFREEVKRAAKDSKDTLLIPSGQTAVDIEGTGKWFDAGNTTKQLGRTETDYLKVNKSIIDAQQTEWVITELRGGTKFKAVPREQIQFQPTKTAFKSLEGKRWYSPTYEENFDLLGNEFVYKLNEEAIPREARKMGLEIIGKIKEGIGEWWKIKIPRERARFPVEAFGVLPFIPQFIKDKEK